VVVAQQQQAEWANQATEELVEQMVVPELSMFVTHLVRKQQQKSVLLSQHLRVRVTLRDTG
jgi:hypothetical protein